MAVSAVSPVSEPPTSVNKTNLEKIESFLNDPTYKEIIESSANYNTRLCIERRLRLPFIDTQTGVAQNHSALFMHRRQRLPGLLPGQIYSYPRQRWRKKRRQYLSVNTRAFARAADSILDSDADMHSISQIENPALQDTDSKDSQLLLKDEVSKEWFYDEQDMLEMDTYDEPDPDSDLDYEETYSKRNKRRKNAGRGRGGTDSPSTPGRRKGSGRGRKKAGHSFEPTPGDPDKPFACELCGARYKTRPGLTYHYGHSHKEGASDENSRDSNASALSVGMGVSPSTPGVPPVGMSGGQPAMESSGDASPTLPQGPSQGHVYQDSYVSFLNQTPGAAGRRGRQTTNTPLPQVSQSIQPQVPPALPPSLPPQQVHMIDDPPMPVLVPEKSLDPSPPTPLVDNPVKEKAAPNPYCDFCLGDSRENKKTGGSEELVSCSDCGRSGHPTCLQFTANMNISVKKYRWQCIECKCCSVCGNSDNDDQLLFCDDCDRGYHMYCLSPPLVNPPEGSWSCKLCIEEFHNNVVPRKESYNKENTINNILEKRNEKNSKRRKDKESNKEEQTNCFSGDDETITSEKSLARKFEKKKRVFYNEEIEPDIKSNKRKKKKQDYSIQKIDEDVKDYSQGMSIKRRQNLKQESHYNDENTDIRRDLPEERSTVEKGKRNSNRYKENIIFSCESDIQDTALIESEIENNQKVNKNSRKGNICQDACDKMETVHDPTNFKSQIFSKQVKSFLDKAYQEHDQTDGAVSNEVVCSKDGHDSNKQLDANERIHIKSLVVIPAECTETITDTNFVIKTKRKRIRKRKRKNINKINGNCDAETSMIHFNSTPKDRPLIHIKFDHQSDNESISSQSIEKDTSIIRNSKLNTSSLRNNINIVPIIRSVNTSGKQNNINSKIIESKLDTESNCGAEIMNSSSSRDLKKLKYSGNGVEAENCLKNVLSVSAHESENIQLLVNGNNSDTLCKQKEHIPVKIGTPESHEELGDTDTVYGNLDAKSNLNSKSTNSSFIEEEAVSPETIALSMNQPILDSPPEIGKMIVFKVLKMSDNYTPEISSSIVGKILSSCQETNQLSMRILYGCEQCEIPKGKFHLEFDEPEADSSVHTFEWADLIEPRLHTPCFS